MRLEPLLAAFHRAIQFSVIPQRVRPSNDFWIKGRWYESLDGSFITDLEDSGCSKQCSAKETKAGRNEWWTKVRTRDGLSGWVREDLNDVVDPVGSNG